MHTLNHIPMASMMLVIVLGFTLGRWRWRGFSLEPAGGTLLIALALGHLGLRPSAGTGSGSEETVLSVGLFGFALFIYSVGFEAGPRLLSRAQSSRGGRFILTGVLVNLFAILIAWGLAATFDLDASTMAGVLAGALTSAPTYAAVSEVVADTTRLSVSFALCYPIGLLGLLFSVQYWPRLLMGERPEAEAAEAPSSGLRAKEGSPEIWRTFEVPEGEFTGATLAELNLAERTGCIITRIRRQDRLLFPTARTTLQAGDRVRVTGRIDELQVFERTVGSEVYDARLSERLPTRRIQVTNPAVIGKSLAELDLTGRFQVLVVSIESGRVLLEPTADAVLARADVVELIGDPLRVQAAVAELGRLEPSTTHTDIGIYAGGILLGVLVGRLSLSVGGLELSLGVAGGLLLAGVLLGRFRQIGPFSANVPPAARQLVRDLGILLFVAETGLQAGARLGEAGSTGLVAALASALAIVLLSLTGAVVVARSSLRLAPYEALGSACGGMTSSAALTVLSRSATPGRDPAPSYAAAYAVASILATMSGHLLIALIGGS